MKRGFFGLGLGLVCSLALSLLLFWRGYENGLLFFHWLDQSTSRNAQNFAGKSDKTIVEEPTPRIAKTLRKGSTDTEVANSVSEPALEMNNGTQGEEQAKRKATLRQASPRRVRVKKKGSPGTTPRPLANISKTMLSDWAERSLFPRVVFRSADQFLPQGLELLNGADYGVGLKEGDRLIALNGQAVSSVAQALAIILGARGAKVASIQAQVVRRIGSEQQTFQISFAQPYGQELPSKLRPGSESSVSEVNQP